MAATNQPDLFPSGAGLAASVAVETHGELGELESFNMTGLLVVGGILLLALGAAVDSNARLL